MQEIIQNQYQPNPFFLPEILSLQEQKKRLRCPNLNQATSVCISKQCLISGLMCLQSKCQCRRTHLKCHHILLDRVLQSIQKHQKQIPQKVKETYRTVYDMINNFIDDLSKLRTKFQRQEQYFGLREQQLQFMDMINDRKTQQINGKMINSLQKFFDAEIQLNKTSKEDIIKGFQIKKKEFDQLCKSIEESYLQASVSNKSIQNNKNNILSISKIIEKVQQMQLLNQWLSESFDKNNNLKYQLLFRASQHNFSASQFHRLCDGQRDTLVIVKNQFDCIIGGFTSQAWKNSGGFIIDVNKKAFMFSLTLKQKYKCLKSQSSLQGFQQYGPIFGAGSQLILVDKCNQKSQSRSTFGKTYNLQISDNVYKYKYDTKQTNSQFTGNLNGHKYKVKQYQVYKIKINE